MEKITFIGLDVDDKACHIHGINNGTGEIFQFSCKPNAGVLERKLERYKTEDTRFKICYEATYLGFSLN